VGLWGKDAAAAAKRTLSRRIGEWSPWRCRRMREMAVKDVNRKLLWRCGDTTVR
jgi:hypothetical protein